MNRSVRFTDIVSKPVFSSTKGREITAAWKRNQAWKTEECIHRKYDRRRRKREWRCVCRRRRFQWLIQGDLCWEYNLPLKAKIQISPTQYFTNLFFIISLVSCLTLWLLPTFTMVLGLVITFTLNFFISASLSKLSTCSCEEEGAVWLLGRRMVLAAAVSHCSLQLWELQ